MKRSLRHATWILVLLGSSCTVGPDYEQPKVPVPDKFTADDGAGAASRPVEPDRWWSRFQDPSLDRLIERATIANLDLKVAEARVREARALRTITASAEYPSVQASGSYSRQQNSLNAISPNGAPANTKREFDFYDAGFDASWEVDVFGGVRRAVEAADAAVEVSVEDRRAVLVSLLGEVARNYVEARGFQEQIASNERNLNTQEQTLDLTRVRAQAGIATDLDVARAEANVSSTRATIPSFRTALAQAAHRIAVLIGEDPGPFVARAAQFGPIPKAPSRIDPGLPSELLRRRPDVRRAERALALETARIGVAVSDLYPKFALTGSIGQQSFKASDFSHSDSTFWSIGPSFRWPIFQGGAIRANIEAAEARADQALNVYKQTILIALEDVENGLVAFAQEQERRESLIQTVSSQQRAVDLANELYSKGLTDFRDVLDAEKNLYVTQIALVQSETQVVSDLVALYKALGGGWETVEKDAVAANEKAASEAAANEKSGAP